MRFLVTGAPGSGTRYTTKLLNELGVSTGHEVALHHGWPDGSFRLGQSALEGEVSWYGAPFVRMFDMPTVHLVRHPLLSIRSINVMQDWMAGGMHRETFKRFVPRVFDYQPGILWAARFWLDWTAWADKADERWSIHQLSVGAIQNMLYRAVGRRVTPTEIATQLRVLPQNIGTHHFKEDLSWEDLGTMKTEAQERAQEYGILKKGEGDEA